MKARSQVGFPKALCFNIILTLQILLLGEVKINLFLNAPIHKLIQSELHNQRL